MKEEIKIKKERKKKVISEGVVELSPAKTPQILLREENGLLRNLEYKYDKYGMIAWKEMLNPEFVVLNRMKFAKDGIDTYSLSKDETEKIKAEATDDKLLVTLAGFRELARIRGYKSVLPAVSVRPDGGVISECTITWIKNFETNFEEVITRGIASASTETVAPTYQPFLEAIASNRAFVRCVREFLGIFTICEEEILIEDVKVAAAKPGSPLHLLQKTCSTYNLKIEDLKQIFREQVENNSEETGWLDSWISFESLPTSVIATLVPKINKIHKQK